MAKLADQIRKIAGIKDLKKELKEISEAVARLKLPGNTSVGYQNSYGMVQNKTIVGGAGGGVVIPGAGVTIGSNTDNNILDIIKPFTLAGSTSPNTDTQAEQEAGKGETVGGGGVGGGSGGGLAGKGGSTGGAINKEKDGQQNIADIMDGKYDVYAVPVTGGSTPNVLRSIAGGHDCESDKEMIVSESVILPSNWSSIDQPPVDISWEQDFYFEVIGAPGGNVYVTTPNEAIDHILSVWSQLGVTRNPATFDSWDPYPTTVGVNGLAKISDPTGMYSMVVAKISCITAYNSTYCVLSEPVSSLFPISSRFQMVKTPTGTYKPPVQDKLNTPSSYTGERSTIDMCFGAGRKARKEPTKTGGSMIYEIDPVSNTPLDGLLRVYDYRGALVEVTTTSRITSFKAT